MPLALIVMCFAECTTLNFRGIMALKKIVVPSAHHILRQSFLF